MKEFKNSFLRSNACEKRPFVLYRPSPLFYSVVSALLPHVLCCRERVVRIHNIRELLTIVMNIMVNRISSIRYVDGAHFFILMFILFI